MIYVGLTTKKQWIITVGTSMAMDATSCNLKVRHWKDPETFHPERWMENPRPDRHLISLSKGTRICLGINVACSEPYVFLGGIVRRYDLYDGTETQTSPTLALRYDCLVSFPTKRSKAVQVKVQPRIPV